MYKCSLAIGLSVVLLLVGCAGNNKKAGTPSPDSAAASQPYDLARLAAEVDHQQDLEAPLQRGTVDLSQSTINYFTQLPAVTGSYPPDREPLTVVDHGPEGDLPIEMQRPTVYVMFNNPIVPVAKLGEPITQTPLMKIEPEVPGVYRWYGTRVLSFQPAAPLIHSPFYTVTVSPDVRSLGGSRLGKAVSFSFNTERVKAVNFYAGNDADNPFLRSEVPTKAARYLVLEFNQPVDPAAVRPSIEVEVGGNPVPFQVGRPAYPESLATRTPRALLVILDQDPPENTLVKINLKAGLRPQKGYPESQKAQNYLVETVTRFHLVDLTASAWDLPRNNAPGTVPIYANFSHPLAQGAEKQAFRVTVNGVSQTPSAVTVFGTTLRVSLNGLEPGDAVSLIAPLGVQDIYGRSLSNAEQAVSVEIPTPFPYADFPDGFHQLEAQFQPQFVYEARNLDSLVFGSRSSDRWDFRRHFESDSAWPRGTPVAMSSWKPNKIRYTVVDFKHLLKNGFGTAYFRSAWELTRENRKDESSTQFAIQVTDIGISTRYAYNRLLVWTTSLTTGKPIPGAKVEWNIDQVGHPVANTDTDGLAVFTIKSGDFKRIFGTRPYRMTVTVTKGFDRSDMQVFDSQPEYTETTYGHGSPDTVESPLDRLFLFTDRGLYKLGETLALRGIHWIQDPQGFTSYKGPYQLQLIDPRSGKTLWSHGGKTSESGGMAETMTLPQTLEPAEYSIRYEARGRKVGAVSFTVAQFRRLAFQVNSHVADRKFFLGDTASVTVSAAYLAGGSMPKSGYTSYWTRKPMPFSPPGPAWSSFVFGPGTWEGERTLSNGQGSLDSQGSVTLQTKTSGQESVGSAYDYTLETTVQDRDRQAVASTAHVLVHPASFYIGARFVSGSASGWWSRFLSTGKSAKLEADLVDPEGKLWTGRTNLTAKLILGSWKSSVQQGVYGRVNTRWDYVETEVKSQKIDVNNGKATWDFQVKDSGDYLLSLEGKDSQGRDSKTVLRFYATGSQWVRRATESPDSIDMVLDKDEYLPGETARILVRSPIPDGRYLMTMEREGLLDQKFIDLKGGQSIIEVPIKDSYVPVIYVALTSFTKREAVPTDYFEPDLGRPRGLFGVTGIRVSTKPVELKVSVVAGQLAYKPGSQADVTVVVQHDGKPVANAEVSVLAVDRGVLDLINYHIPNPLDFFYDPSCFPLAVHGDDSRRLLMKPVTYDTTRLTGGGDDKLPVRKDFRPLALFEPFAKTDANGVAVVHFSLPDSLTTYRITAMALKDNSLGIQENELLVQNPLNVRAALPRLFRNRDTAAAGVILKNLTRDPLKVEVRAESDLLTIAGDAVKSVEIPGQGTYELPFLLSAGKPGKGSITFTVHSDVVNERLVEKVQVEQPLIEEAFTTVGMIAADAKTSSEGLVIPSQKAPGYGSLTLLAASSLRPYAEPSVERLLGAAASWSWESDYDKLTASFAFVTQHQHEDLARALAADLGLRQLSSGAVTTSTRDPKQPDPYISLLTAHFLQFAAERKFALPGAPDLSRLDQYLLTLKMDTHFDPYFQAYLSMILAAEGLVEPRFLHKVEDFGDRLGLGGYGLLTQAYLIAKDRESAVRVERRSKNFVMIGTQTVDLKESYEVTNYWSSEVAEMAILLKNAVDLGEDSGFLQRLAGSLHRTERYWQTRNDDLWTLLGFLPLLDAEGQTPGTAHLDVTAKDVPLVALDLSPKAAEARQSLSLEAEPLSKIPRDQVLPLVLTKTGTTPVYYTSILRYALPNETSGARDEGIEVESRYETLDGTEVAENKLTLGETYRVRLDVSTTKRRQRLDLQVPVPSGVEIIDPTFVTTGRFLNKGGTNSQNINRETVYGGTVDVQAEGTGSWSQDDWYWYWYQPDSFALDNRMVYRWTDFYAGTRTVTFLVRATTPGIFPTPGASASLEFEPEVFGRSAGSLFVIPPQ